MMPSIRAWKRRKRSTLGSWGLRRGVTRDFYGMHRAPQNNRRVPNTSLAKKSKINLADLKTMFFVAWSEKTHPGFATGCANVPARNFTPRSADSDRLCSPSSTGKYLRDKS